jgi:hypothetical protein
MDELSRWMKQSPLTPVAVSQLGNPQSTFLSTIVPTCRKTSGNMSGKGKASSDVKALKGREGDAVD